MTSSKLKPSVYIAIVEAFDPETWIIKFKIPKIMDNMKDYPVASPLSDHVFQLSKNDEVYIFSNMNEVDNQFYYLPISIRKFAGIRYTGSIIDVTRDDIIDTISKYNYEFYDKSETRIVKSKDISDEKVITGNQITIVAPLSDDTFSELNKTLGRNPIKITTKSGGSAVITIKSSGEIVIESSNTINITSNNININGSGNTIIDGIKFSTHIHDGVHGPTGGPHN